MRDTLHIGLVVSSFDRGGLEQVVYNLYKGYRELGAESYVLCKCGSAMGHFASMLPPEHIVAFEEDEATFFGFCERHGIGLLHYHYATDFMEQARARGYRLVYTMHNAYTWMDREQLRAYAERLNSTDMVAAVSNFVKRYYQRITAQGDDRICVIGNGMDQSELRLDELPEGYTRRGLGIPDGRVVIAQLASFCPIKHSFGLLGAIERLNQAAPRFHLVLAGHVTDARYYRELMQAVSASPQRDCITVLDPIPHRYVGAFLRQTVDIFALTTQQEGCSNAVLEALLCGAPMVLTDTGNAAEIAPLGAGVLVKNAYEDILKQDVASIERIGRQRENRNTQAMVDAFETIAADLEGFKRRAKACAHNASDFTVENMARAYLRLFSSLKRGEEDAAQDQISYKRMLDAEAQQLLRQSQAAIGASLQSRGVRVLRVCAHGLVRTALVCARHPADAAAQVRRATREQPLVRAYETCPQIERDLQAALECLNRGRAEDAGAYEQSAISFADAAREEILHTLRMRGYRALRGLRGLRQACRQDGLRGARRYGDICRRYLRGDKHELLVFASNDRLVFAADALDNLGSALRRSIRQQRIPATDEAIDALAPAAARDCAEVPEEARLLRSPLISVLMPIYNHANVAEQAIRSVLAQDYPNFELVILDDGSKDDLAGVLVRFKDDPRVRIYHQQNQKLPNALTNLHRLARGKFITWTSADNLMDANMLTTLCNALVAHPEASTVFGNVRIIDENGQCLTDEPYRDGNRDAAHPGWLHLHRDTQALGFESDNYVNACFLYSARACDALNRLYYADMYGIEDYDFWLRMQKCGPICHIERDAPLYSYRVHRNTISTELTTTQPEKHRRRGEMLIELEARRREYCDLRWNVRNAGELEQVLQRLPVNFGEGKRKNLCFEWKGKLDARSKADAVVSVDGGVYRARMKADGFARVRFSLPRGYALTPLALKAREYNDSRRYLYAAQGVILGCHAPLNGVDARRLDAVLKANAPVNFCFLCCDAPEDGVRAVIEANPNAWIQGQRPYGAAYVEYASWDAVFVPPYREDAQVNVDQLSSLGLACGKWCCYPENLANQWRAPYGAAYGDGAALALGDAGVDAAVADRYLAEQSAYGRLKRLLQLLNGAMLDVDVERPAFSDDVVERQDPVEYKF